MTVKKVNDKGQVENNTGSELDILKRIEKAFYRNNDQAKRRNTAKSLNWFRSYIPKSYNKVQTGQMFRDRSLWTNRIVPGELLFFEYDAEHKDKLPVWDRYPMIFPWDQWVGKSGKVYFIGINLHYLPPVLRLQAMKALLTLRNQKRYRPNTRLKISWGVLKALSNSRLFEHSIKMYIMENVKSTFVKIPPSSWEMAIYLPLARWQNGSKSLAWKIK